ncbi:hypothetical protein niasHT_011897 [Heterodera trifolii]|uniref:Uncharacterized protein n=1 Tax=Heterodera trifolii TaxID=157864 RepID=A0ABD2KWA2_9BILA
MVPFQTKAKVISPIASDRREIGVVLCHGHSFCCSSGEWLKTRTMMMMMMLAVAFWTNGPGEQRKDTK